MSTAPETRVAGGPQPGNAELSQPTEETMVAEIQRLRARESALSTELEACRGQVQHLSDQLAQLQPQRLELLLERHAAVTASLSAELERRRVVAERAGSSDSEVALARVLASRSWRLTAPLRWLARGSGR